MKGMKCLLNNIKRNNMRFKSKKQHGIIIERKWFAFFPVSINGETRWLEFVKVRGYYYLNDLYDKWYWNSKDFVD